MAQSIGQSLREARVARSIDLTDLESGTKIRLRYLRAIEEEDWDALPGAAYARGFIRTYAQFVGLDGEALVDEYRRRYERGGPEAAQAEAAFEQPAAAARRPIAAPGWLPLALGAGAVLALLAVIGLVGGSDGGKSPKGAEGARPRHEQAPAATKETTTTAPARVSLTLAASGPVWVCLEDGSGRALVDGQTLAAGQREGPFEAQRFVMTFGNGQVRMDVDGSAVEVPAASDPLGYEVTSAGARMLGEAARPSCT